MHFGQVRRSRLAFGASRKHQVTDVEIAGGTVISICFGVDLSSQSQGCFANLIRRPGVPDDRRIKFPVMNNDNIVAEPRQKRMIGLPQHKSWQHYEGVRFRNQETVFFEIGNFPSELVDLFLECFLPLRSSVLLIIFRLDLL
jgi:hypothetical protein